MSEANKLEELELEGKNNVYWNNFVVKGVSLHEGSYKKSREMHHDDILKDDLP